jgi:S1-C subfamily serine protease
VTNCHLIQLPAGVKLQRAGSAMGARVVAADREGDRCVLEPDKSLTRYVASGRSYRALPIGEDVAAIGNPKGLDTSLSRGIVGQKRERGGLTLLQTDAAISSGSSGGGLFDTAGNLVGITTFKVAAGESLNFAIAVDEFCR